jgi:hypothetical protein
VQIIHQTISFLIVVGLISACAQSEFAGDTGQGVRNGMKDPDKDPNKGPTENPTTTKDNDDGLNTDDGGKIELVEADLQVDRLPDSARFQNCLSAHVVGQPVVELGCNRNAPNSDSRPALAKNVRMKLLTNSCNQLRVIFKTNSGGGLKDNVTTAVPGRISSGATKDRTGAKGPGINIVKEANGSYLIEANDNNDERWHDVYLRVTPPVNRPNIKFTIENSGIPCG